MRLLSLKAFSLVPRLVSISAKCQIERRKRLSSVSSSSSAWTLSSTADSFLESPSIIRKSHASGPRSPSQRPVEPSALVGRRSRHDAGRVGVLVQVDARQAHPIKAQARPSQRVPQPNLVARLPSAVGGVVAASPLFSCSLLSLFPLFPTRSLHTHTCIH